MGHGRNVLVVASADVVIGFGGGPGTLSELALALKMGKPALAFGTLGWSGRLADAGVLEAVQDVTEAVDRCRVLVAQRPPTR